MGSSADKLHNINDSKTIIPDEVRKVSRLLTGLLTDSFYGEFQINFQNGKIVNCKKTESIKI